MFSINPTALSRDDTTGSAAGDLPLVLRTRGLSLAFGRVRAVDDLNLTVRSGEVYGFLGRNGAGKTTTIRMLMGIIKADRGSMDLFGQTTRRTTIAQKRRIGYVSQGQFFYPWMTCRRLGRFVAGFYPSWDATEYERLLRVLDVPDDRKVSALSGGTRVKLALALALAHRPEMLILDEPTAGLDPVARREFLDMIGRQARTHHRTTLFSSHLVDEVERVADRVGIIHRGRLCYEGKIDTLCDMVRRVRVEPARLEPMLLQPAMPVVLPVQLDPVNTNCIPSATIDSSMDGAQQIGDGELIPADVSLQGPDEFVLVASASTGSISPDNRMTRRALNELLAAGPFRLVREQLVDGESWAIVSAAPSAWGSHPFPADSVSRLSLEDIFIAMASEQIAEL